MTCATGPAARDARELDHNHSIDTSSCMTDSEPISVERKREFSIRQSSRNQNPKRIPARRKHSYSPPLPSNGSI
jgi:hypothetical protein